MMQHRVQRIHFVGIGGVGMSGIAEVLHNLGYSVSGSDANSSANTQHLEKLGVKVFIGHGADNVNGAQVVVTSTAVSKDNPEVAYALENKINIIPRAVMLAELMRFKYGIAIAGTHGKTTTTSLCAEVLRSCGLDPTFIIGGRLAVTGSNAKLGSGDFLVAEADESDASFLCLHPLITVVTNIDQDHMDTYGHDEEKLKQAFIQFLHNLPFYGRAIVCLDNQNIVSILPKIERPITTYGLSQHSDFYAKDIKDQNGKMSYIVCCKKLDLEYPILLNLCGIHNVLNSLAVIAVALECGGKIEDIARGLSQFHGVGRRCQHYPDINYNGIKATLIDDYGHHPTELAATIDALKNAYPSQRMVLLFQPHRYTRTRDLFNDFVQVLSQVENLIILDVYAAGEEPIINITGEILAQAIANSGKSKVIFAKDVDDAREKLLTVLQNNDLVVTMGAGNISKLPQMLNDL